MNEKWNINSNEGETSDISGEMIQQLPKHCIQQGLQVTHRLTKRP